MSRHYRRRVRSRVESLLRKASRYYQREFPRADVSFDVRGATAGLALLREWRVRLNGDLLERYGEAFIEDTVPHEVAHLVATRVYGRRIQPHGPEWRAVMALFGAQPDRCHKFEVAPLRKLRTFRYECECREHWLTSIRHNRISRGVQYLCTECLRPLTAA